MSFTHFLLTRFNVPIVYAEPGTGLDPGWLAHRFELFEEFCYPSVRAQTSPPFRWLILFDERTPEPWRSRVEEFARWEVFLPLYLPEYSHEAVQERIAGLLPPEAQFLITTRVDNDDALHRDYLREIRRQAVATDLELLDFPKGYVWHEGRLYRDRQPSNPFASLVERIEYTGGEGLRTIFWQPHHLLPGCGVPIRTIEAEPMWLQVVHGRNVSNEVRGIREPVSALGDAFSIRHPARGPEPVLGYRLDRWRGILKARLREIKRRYTAER